ncbi:hypothetical protein [Sphingobacterium hungaricum]|uniref:Uncharacterized protein n=1 Tax=Sphingobacterium hungaricum TaxID=2082723 RepID=A0A928V1I3_9SPHI|nr:hypothetical protein [Sphingobacterium hungaricum]MBE8715266.1 hypothetical protein [Sphingobacterium hungaricum]
MKINWKSKGLFKIAIIFFLLVNTSYYWEGKLGLFAFPVFLLLFIVYLFLAAELLIQFFFLLKEKFADKSRLLYSGFLTTVLIVVFFRPYGLIDFEKFEADNLLIAERESVANCKTVLKLKDDFTFKERNVCFGVMESTGKYYIQNDTIYFDNVRTSILNDYHYQFAVIKTEDENHFDFVRYESLTDTVGNGLWITKNELHKLKDKSNKRTGFIE